MDDPVQLPSNLLGRLKRAADLLEKSSEVRVISHNDADGITAAGVICSTILRKNKQFQCSMVKGFDEKQVREAVEGFDLLIIADMGSNNLAVLESLGIDVIVLDHHKPERDSEKVVHANPHIFGIDGAISACAASVSMLFAVNVSQSNWDLVWIAFSGIVGDRQHMRGLTGINAYLLEQATKMKLVEERPGQLYNDGALKDALHDSTEPFVGGVSGDRKGVAEVMSQAGLLDHLAYESLDDSQKQRLNSIIMLRLLQQGSNLASFEEVLCNRYYFPDRKQYGKDLANAMNACGKSDNTSLGLAALLGDYKAMEEATTMKDTFGRTLLATSLQVQQKGLRQAEHIQYFLSPNPDVSSETCGVMMQWVGDQSKPTISLSHKGGEVRISSRANRHIVDDLGVDLGSGLKQATAAVGGNGGGHNVASGGRIPMGKEEEFISVLDRIVGQQKAARLEA